MRLTAANAFNRAVRSSRRIRLLPAFCRVLGVVILAAMSADASTPESHRVDALSHWAFRPVTQPTVPTANSGWGRNSIDAFLAVGYEQRGLIPLDPAPPHVLLRRLYLDLVGVPPTTAELEEFTA